ncbi:acyl-CoA dehydrogenase family protein [Halopseudomonas pelagia]|uniref:Medium-chain specific acyl-CoA dehydrogenase, mitochondrial n=1 Tax=Halopseudomonas pelagia TaxID=553151 RepID=A0AA91U0K6_9GAMM|nr:acyl-CoA dehydrogenase family protein [Halopseudomonas pelagia]PCC98166.1 acyl-CoA dehydrogenase [Halopseudomonas pelagia]QFY57312.1 acyl-CoA dehydrogenase [Halopseudomonas pelagia]
MIQPSEKANALIAQINAFVDEEIKPLEQREGLRWGDGPNKTLLREVWKRSCELGFYNVMLPEELGGAGLNVVDLCAIKEATVLSGTMLAPHILGELSGPPRIGHLFKVASEYQVEEFLRPICRADRSVCFALTEADAGSDASALKTTAELQGDHYRLNGSKRYISGASYADTAILLAQTKRDGEAAGISAFYVDLNSPGVRVDSDYGVMSGKGSHGDIFLEDVNVPVANLIGSEGAGFKLAMGRITLNRLLHCPTMLGMAGLALELSMQHARSRSQFGKPIAAFQAVNHMIADMATELAAARSLVYATAAQYDAGGDIRTQASMCKLFVSETSFRIIDRAVQVHGGAGLIQGHPVELLFRASRMMRILTGTSEIQRNTIAKGILMP